MSLAPSLDDVRAAARRIGGLAWRTPLIHSPWLSEVTRAEVWLKLEIVQATGAFKIRGAANALRRLVEAGAPAAGIATASAGNHGLAIATAARRLGLKARIHLPETAPDAKRLALARLGAEIVLAPTYDAAEAAVVEDVRRSGATFVSAYSHTDVIAGAGTVALEMFDERPDLDTLIVPLGGGGLLSGTAIVARALARDALIVGAEAGASPVFTSALAAGRPVTVDVKPTLADGLAGNMEPDSQTFPLVRDLVDRVVTVDEMALATAMRDLILRDRLVAEGAGAAGVAALPRLDLAGRRVGIILSGRNVDAKTTSGVVLRKP